MDYGIEDFKVFLHIFDVSVYENSPPQLFECEEYNSDTRNRENVIMYSRRINDNRKHTHLRVLLVIKADQKERVYNRLPTKLGFDTKLFYCGVTLESRLMCG